MEEEAVYSAVESKSYQITEEINAMIQYVVSFCENLSQAGYNKALRRLAKKAKINDIIKVHYKGQDNICPKYECMKASVAQATYDYLRDKVSFSSDNGLFNLSVQDRIGLPSKYWKAVSVGEIILKSIESHNITIEDISCKLNMEKKTLDAYITGQLPIDIKLLGKLLWLLDINIS